MFQIEKSILARAADVRNPAKPTPIEKALLWNDALEAAAELTANGLTLRAARKAVRQILWKTGVTLARNETSLAQPWRVKEEAWRESSGDFCTLKDKRAGAPGRAPGIEIPPEDLDCIIAHAVKFGGRVSQAWRHVFDHRLLSTPVLAHYESLPAYRKSYVPQRVRDAVAPEVKTLRDEHHGPRTAKLNGAFIERDWSMC